MGGNLGGPRCVSEPPISIICSLASILAGTLAKHCDHGREFQRDAALQRQQYRSSAHRHRYWRGPWRSTVDHEGGEFRRATRIRDKGRCYSIPRAKHQAFSICRISWWYSMRIWPVQRVAVVSGLTSQCFVLHRKVWYQFTELGELDGLTNQDTLPRLLLPQNQAIPRM